LQAGHRRAACLFCFLFPLPGSKRKNNTMPNKTLNKMQLKHWAGMTARTLVATCFVGALAVLSMDSAMADNPYGANYFPNVPLTTQDGKAIQFYDEIKGKSVAINVIYTSCKDECPLETAKMAQLAQIFGDKMGKDMFFYSISIDPKHDTPAVLKAYAKNFNVGAGWQFLTGKPEDIKVLVKKLGLSRGSDLANKDGHTASLMVGNEPTGQWMRNSAVDNPIFLSATIGSFLGWREDPAARKTYANAGAVTLDPGQYMFQSRCSACHTIGGGDKMGPDLAGVTTRRERNWVARYLTAPDKMRAEGDPIAMELSKKYKNARMPDQKMGGADLLAILTYLEDAGGAPGKQAKNENLKKETAASHVHDHVH
jgi:protein SCO1